MESSDLDLWLGEALLALQTNFDIFVEAVPFEPTANQLMGFAAPCPVFRLVAALPMTVCLKAAFDDLFSYIYDVFCVSNLCSVISIF